jgi:hypothetical protein
MTAGQRAERPVPAAQSGSGRGAVRAGRADVLHAVDARKLHRRPLEGRGPDRPRRPGPPTSPTVAPGVGRDAEHVPQTTRRPRPRSPPATTPEPRRAPVLPVPTARPEGGQPSPESVGAVLQPHPSKHDAASVLIHGHRPSPVREAASPLLRHGGVTWPADGRNPGDVPPPDTAPPWRCQCGHRRRQLSVPRAAQTGPGPSRGLSLIRLVAHRTNRSRVRM